MSAALTPTDQIDAASFNESRTLRELIALTERPDPLTTPMHQLAEMQLQAAREVLSAHRRRIQVLQRRIEETNVTEIRTLADLVPLLFAHTAYKSYPLSFIQQGQWKRMLKWFGTLSAVPVDNVDISDVEDIDDFIDRLWAAGHKLITSSGTSGKVSLLNRIECDYEVYGNWMRRHHCWPKPMPREKLRFYQMTPRHGPYIVLAIAPLIIERLAKPDAVRFLTDDRMRIAWLMRAAEMRRKIGEGSLSPSEIADYESEVKSQQAKAMAEFESISDEILDHLHEPLSLNTQWGMLWRIVEKARARGIPEGSFHPGTVIGVGGGAKGLALPPDYFEQAVKYIGPIHHMFNVYGCCEMSVTYPACEKGHYHIIPWIIPFVLDAAGEKLLDHRGGVVEGRFAFLDLSYSARWGGLITGDKVTMNYAETCECGRPGPVVVKGSIARYSDIGDDKIGCAGTIESYIRGAV